MIFYFSGTGNSRWAAYKLASILDDDVVAMQDYPCDGSSIEVSGRLGFVFPIHGWRPPKIVRSFLSGHKFSLAAGTYVYALCTAGDSVGLAVDMFRLDLAAEGLRLDAVETLIMPESYVGLPFMDVDTASREREKKQAAVGVLNSFANVVRQRERGYEHLIKGHLPWLLTYPVGGFFLNHIVSDRPFRVEKDKCIKCGRCSEVCPVGDIEGGKGLMPRWLHKKECLSCFSCYHHCPTHAIEYGCRTKRKGQYYYEKNKV